MLRCCAAGQKNLRDNPIRQSARDFFFALLIFLAVFALAALDARPARPQTAAASAAQSASAGMQSADLTPTRMDAGTLLIRPAPADKAGGETVFSSAPRLNTDVEITVSGPIARATVTQIFRNGSEQRAEGLYVFPLPEGAAVDALTMQIGERSVAGEIRPRGDAQALYEGAGAAGTAASAIERRRPNMFASAVADIAPGETVTVRMQYQQTLRWHDGAYSLRLPLLVAPRYGRISHARSVRYDGKPSDALPNGPGAVPISVRVKLDAGFPLGSIESATHAVSVKRQGEQSALLTLQQAKAPRAEDFELTWRPKETNAPVARIFTQNRDNAEYILAMITPPTTASAPSRRAREVIFVVDTSGSMAGSSIHQARDALKMAVSRLDKRDRFNIIAFESTYEELFPKPVAADAEGKAIARQFIERLMASGGTEMIRPLSAALRDAQPDDTSRVRQVVLITDGTIANGQQLFSEIAVKRGRSRLFLIGIGPKTDEYLLRRAAEVGRGGYVHIGTQWRLGGRMDEFLRRLERPMLTEIRIAWPKGVRPETWPDPLPDLYAGEPLVVSGRLEGLPKGGGAVAVSGTFEGEPWRSEIDLGAAAEGTGVARLWAGRKIASLVALNLYTRNDGGDIDAQIEKVALEHRVVSRMTSLVAVDQSTAPRDPDEASPASAATPREFAVWPGYSEPVGHGAAQSPRSGKGPGTSSKQAPAKLAGAPLPSNGKQANSPTAASPESAPAAPAELRAGFADFLSERLAAVAIMALLFATMSALTLGLWRHLGRNYAATRRARRHAGVT